MGAVLMEMNWYLFAAYTLIWAVSFVYLGYLGRRQAELRREIAALRASVLSSGKPSGKAGAAKDKS